jgi:hypothetical protein
VVGTRTMVSIEVEKNLWCRFPCTGKMHIGLTSVVNHSKCRVDNVEHIFCYGTSKLEVPSSFRKSLDTKSSCNPKRSTMCGSP